MHYLNRVDKAPGPDPEPQESVKTLQAFLVAALVFGVWKSAPGTSSITERLEKEQRANFRRGRKRERRKKTSNNFSAETNCLQVAFVDED